MNDFYCCEVSMFQNSATAVVVGMPDTYDSLDCKSGSVGKYTVAFWGDNNDLPQQVLKKIKKSDVMSSNLTFNVNVAYGLGPRLVKVKRDANNQIIEKYDVIEGKEFDFFQRNDIDLYIQKALYDMTYFHNSFTELIIKKDSTEIHSIRCLEAVFSRWSLDQKNNIDAHLYSRNWDRNECSSDKIIRTPVLDEFNLDNDLLVESGKKNKSFIVPVYMPSPGDIYYSTPSWYSLFKSGWYDLSVAVAEVKKAILKNQLGVKFIVAISPKYFHQLATSEGVDIKDVAAMKTLRDREVKKINDFLAGGDNFCKSMVVTKESIMTAAGIKDEQHISIEPVTNDFGKGEFISDTETAANVICYAMGIHPTLIGATPGKSASTSGTDKRELYLIKQALSKSMLNRVLKPLQLVKKHNKWDKDIMIEIPEFLFTTLDQSETGKVAVVNSNI